MLHSLADAFLSPDAAPDGGCGGNTGTDDAMLSGDTVLAPSFLAFLANMMMGSMLASLVLKLQGEGLPEI